MRRVMIWLSTAALAGTCGVFAIAGQSGKGLPLWDFYDGALRHAKYIDLTHAIAPGDHQRYSAHHGAAMHGHEPLDTDNTAPEFVGEKWLLQHNFAQAEGVANLDQVPEAGALITIGFAKFEGGTGGFARYIAIAPPDWPFGVTIDNEPGAPLPTHAHPLRRGTDGVLRETP